MAVKFALEARLINVAMTAQSLGARKCLLPRSFAVRALALWAFMGSAVAASLSPASAASVHPELWPAGGHDLSGHPSTEAFVDLLLAHMSLEEKVGQMIQAGTTLALISWARFSRAVAMPRTATSGRRHRRGLIWRIAFIKHHWPILIQRTGRSRFYSGSMPCMVMARSWAPLFSRTILVWAPRTIRI